MLCGEKQILYKINLQNTFRFLCFLDPEDGLISQWWHVFSKAGLLFSQIAIQHLLGESVIKKSCPGLEK